MRLVEASYAELAAAYPQAGAEYVYIRHAAPNARWLAYGVGFVLDTCHSWAGGEPFDQLVERVLDR